MFVRQLNRRFAALFSGYNDVEHGPFTAANAARFLKDSRLVRCKDYLFDVSSRHSSRTATSTSNWFFILTNAAVYFPGMEISDYPRIEIDFIDSVVKSPFSDRIEEDPGVPSELVFGREGLHRYEEYKNLFYVLGDHINVKINAIGKNDNAFAGFVLLSGVEVDIDKAVT